MPRYVIILLDDAILRYADTRDRILPWIITQFQRTIDARYDQLSKKARPPFTTQVIWVKPVPKVLTHKWYEYQKKDKRDINHQ